MKLSLEFIEIVKKATRSKENFSRRHNEWISLRTVLLKLFLYMINLMKNREK
jgi:hypothetical protein